MSLGSAFYCDVSLYTFSASYTDEEFEERELWESTSFSQRVGQINSNYGDETRGTVIDVYKRQVRDEDIFGGQKKKKTRKNESSSVGQKLTHFSDLKNGDYVVHENHGIGKFIGIEQLDVQGVKKDYLKIKYAGQDMLCLLYTSSG